MVFWLGKVCGLEGLVRWADENFVTNVGKNNQRMKLCCPQKETLDPTIQ